MVNDMPNVNIEDKLYQDIKEYCKLNKLTIIVFVNDLLKKNFMVEKYDDAPPFFKKKKVEAAEPATVTETIKKDGTFEQENIDIKRVMENGQTAEEFRQQFLAEPEPVKKKDYVKPEVISMEVKKDEAALTEKEKARKRIQYL